MANSAKKIPFIWILPLIILLLLGLLCYQIVTTDNSVKSEPCTVTKIHEKNPYIVDYKCDCYSGTDKFSKKYEVNDIVYIKTKPCD